MFRIRILVRFHSFPKFVGKIFFKTIVGTHIVIVVNVGAILLLIDLDDLHVVDRWFLMLFKS